MSIIKLKRGESYNMQGLAQDGEPVFCRDTAELFVGTGDSIVKVNSYESEVAEALWNSAQDASFTADQFYTKEEMKSVLACIAAQNYLTGGGTFSYSATFELKWSVRIMAMGMGKGSHFSTDGYFEILTPASGVSIPRIGTTPVSVTANGIPLGAWDALYYLLPIGSTKTTQNGNFFIANYSYQNVIPYNAVRIALRDSDSSNRIILWTGKPITAGSTGSAH